MSEHHGSDKGAAFRGLVITAILLFIMSFSIVQLTHRHYMAKEGAESGKTK